MFLHIQDESICFLMDIFLAFQAVEAKVLPFDFNFSFPVMAL